MTAAFDALIAAASGVLEFRLVIEGCDTVFVTAESMAGAQSDGRTRVPGLRRDSMGFSERVFIAAAEHDVSIDNISIDEVGGAWLGEATRVFTTIAGRVSRLTTTLASVDGTANVPDGAGAFYTVDNYYHIGTETVKVTAINAAGNPDVLTISRGQWGTTAQEHPVTAGANAQETVVYDAPTGWVKRRCWLYAHTADELATTDDGTVIWRGILSREPALAEDDALSWSLAIDSRLSALDAPLAGGADGGFALRGIYYPGETPWHVVMTRWSGATRGGTITQQLEVKVAGFWETTDAFARAVVVAMNAAASGASWGVSFDYVVTPFGWALNVTTASADVRYISVNGGSYADGYFGDGLRSGAVSGEYDPLDDVGPPIGTVSASTTYHCNRRFNPGVIDDANAQLGARTTHVSILGLPQPSTSTDIASYPITYLYLNQLGSLSTDDDIIITPPTVKPDGSQWGDGEEPVPQVLKVSSVQSAIGAVSVAEGGDASRHPRLIAAGAQQPTIDVAIRFASGDGDLEDFRASLVSKAPSVANRGRGPFVTSDDFPAGGWTAVAEAAAGRAWLEHRVYSFSSPVKAIDVLREEWKLYGLIPYLDADGKLDVRPLTLGATTLDAAITSAEHLVDESLGGMTGDADGLVTVVKVLTGYDPTEDKHLGETYIFRGLEAIARVHDERVLEIAPYAKAVGAEPTWEDLQSGAWSIITLFGNRRTQVVKIDVSLAAFGVLIGDTVSLTIGALPSDGARTEWAGSGGMNARRGIVIGRSWDLAAAGGTLEILLHELDVTGYAPSGRVSSASGSGTSWTLTLEASRYSDGTDASYFFVGMRVKLLEWDAASPTIRRGFVNSVSGNDVSVDLDSSWTGLGGATYIVTATEYDDPEGDPAFDYMYQADATGRLLLAGGTRNPGKTFAP